MRNRVFVDNYTTFKSEVCSHRCLFSPDTRDALSGGGGGEGERKAEFRWGWLEESSRVGPIPCYANLLTGERIAVPSTRIIPHDRPILCPFLPCCSLSHPFSFLFSRFTIIWPRKSSRVYLRRIFVPENNFFSFDWHFVRRKTKRHLSHLSSSGGNRLARKITPSVFVEPR